MSQAPDDWVLQLDELVGALLDDALTEQQTAQLQELLRSQPGARRRFAERMQLASLLEEELKLDSIESHQVESASARVSGHWPRSAWMALVPVVAVAIVLALILFGPFRNRPEGGGVAVKNPNSVGSVLDSGVAVVTRMVEARWHADAQVDVGSSIAPGVLQLEAGLVQFEFYRGAVVVVEGPAELQFVDADRLICRHGRLRAHVPPQSQGFAVLSPQFELVDLGTEFGMSVAEDGSAAVHVFEGKVELYDADSDRSDQSRREVLAASGVSVSATGEFQAVATESESFVSSARLRQLATEDQQRRVSQWRTASERLREDPRVVVYYSFEKEVDSPRELRSQSAQNQSAQNQSAQNQSAQNQSAQNRALDGAIVGGTWSTGRWPGKGALEFKRPGDRVRLHIPGEYESLTYSAWVRIDGLDRAFSALMLTNGFDGGEPHWQIRGDGRLLLGVRGRSGPGIAYDSEPVLSIKRLGQWVHLATAYDGADGSVTHFVDGRVVSQQKVQGGKVPLTLGDTEIGNWGTPPTYSPQKIRNLNGRIDELILFGEALSAQEVRNIYEAGRP